MAVLSSRDRPIESTREKPQKTPPPACAPVVSCIQETRGVRTAAGRKSTRNATILIARDHSLKWNERVSPDSGFGVFGLDAGERRPSDHDASSLAAELVCGGDRGSRRPGKCTQSQGDRRPGNSSAGRADISDDSRPRTAGTPLRFSPWAGQWRRRCVLELRGVPRQRARRGH